MTGNDSEHMRMLLGLIVRIYPTPWTVSAHQSGDGHAAWRLCDAEGACLEYLSADVDAPAFVAWVNGIAKSTTTRPGMFAEVL